MKKIYLVIGAVFVACLISACDGKDVKKMLENKSSPKGSPFGEIEGSYPDPKKDQKDDTNKAKPNGQPFGSLE